MYRIVTFATHRSGHFALLVLRQRSIQMQKGLHHTHSAQEDPDGSSQSDPRGQDIEVLEDFSGLCQDHEV